MAHRSGCGRRTSHGRPSAAPYAQMMNAAVPTSAAGVPAMPSGEIRNRAGISSST